MKSIRSKIILISCIICISSILLATIFSYKILSNNIKEQTYRKLEETSRRHAAEIEGWLSVQIRILNELYDEIIYRNDFNNESLINYFRYKNQKNPDIKEYYIAFPDNVFVRGVGIWTPDESYNLNQREWYRKAIENNGVQISSPYVDSNHGEVIITLSKAIRVNGKIIGVLGSDISIDHIVHIINESKPLEGGYGFLVDNNGNILAHPHREFLYSKDKGLTSIDTIYNDDIIVTQVGKEELKSIIDYDGEERFLLYTDLGFSGWDIGLAVPVDEVMKPLDKVVGGSVILAIILTLVSVVLTFILGNSISQPIKVATNYIEQIANLDITQEPDEEYLNMKDEIGRMFKSFEAITNSLRGFLIELGIISNKISTFSDELAALSYKTSMDADNMLENAANIAEINDSQINKMSKLIMKIEDLNKRINTLIVEDKPKEELINQFKEIIEDIDNVVIELTQVQHIDKFKSEQIKNIYSLAEKQTSVMEGISSASQCLAELGEELNIFIDKFKK